MHLSHASPLYSHFSYWVLSLSFSLFLLMHLSTLMPVLFPSIYLCGFYPFLSHLSSDLYLNEIRKTTPVLLPTIYLDGFYLIFQHLFENSLVVEKIYASPFSTHLSCLAFSFSLSSISLSYQLMFAKTFFSVTRRSRSDESH